MSSDDDPYVRISEFQEPTAQRQPQQRSLIDQLGVLLWATLYRLWEILRNSWLDLDQQVPPSAEENNDAAGIKRPTRFGPFLAVALAAGFGLWTLRTEAIAIPYPNDDSVHLLTVKFALQEILAGHLPFTGWFPDLSLGSPFLMHYQSAPAVITGLFALVIGAGHALSYTLYVLLSLWPISIYVAMRLLGWDRWSSAAAAAVSPLLASQFGYGFEHESYVWYGSGLFPQLWAMWVLPLALGFAWQAISQRRHYFAAMLTAALTIAFHFLTAYWLGLAFIVLVLLRPTQIIRRAGRGALIAVGAGFATLWVTVPLAVFAKWSAANEFIVNTFWDDSYGARRILGALISGNIYDNGRWPVITVLVAIGLLVSLTRSRRDERSRALVLLWLMSLLLYFGRPTLRPIIDLLPGNKDLLLHRYIAVVQLCGIFLAGVAVVWLGGVATGLARLTNPTVERALAGVSRLVLVKQLNRWTTQFSALGIRLVRRISLRAVNYCLARRRDILSGLVATVALAIVLMPAWTHVAAYDYLSASSGIRSQQIADTSDGVDVNNLITKVQSLGGGRVYAGEPSNWGRDFQVGQVPVYIYLADMGVDAVGFTLRTYSLMNDPEVFFDPYNFGDYQLFGIRYLILPSVRPLTSSASAPWPPVSATFVEQSGPYVLYSLDTSGYVEIVDSTAPISANASDLGAQTEAFVDSALPGQSLIPTIAFDGQPAATPTIAPGEKVSGPPGRVDSQNDDPENGAFDATVTLNRTAVVLLTSSFDPGWSVTVDGTPATTEMMAPALVGVTVVPGTHVISFRYHGYTRYPLLFAISLLSVLVFGLAPILRRRIRRRTTVPPTDE